MTTIERNIISGILALIALLVGIDIATDSRDGVVLWHVLSEGVVGLAALVGIFTLLRGSITLKHRLNREIQEFTQYRKESESWRAESRKYIDGLSEAIDRQLVKWRLTSAEKEVAFLILKGLSIKDIADIRKTTEKTARIQASAIYSKAGISGRSELSAFFLEDLLPPVSAMTSAE